MDYQSPEQMRRQAVAIRQKLMGKPEPFKKAEIIPVEERKPSVRVVPPIWKIYPTEFNSHVREWQRNVVDMRKIERDAGIIASIAERVTEGHEAKKPANEIIMEVLENYPWIRMHEIKSRSRTKDLAFVRHMCMYMVHIQRPDLSLPSIGRIFGGRDHTTVLFALRKMRAYLGDPEAKEFLELKAKRSEETREKMIQRGYIPPSKAKTKMDNIIDRLDIDT